MNQELAYSVSQYWTWQRTVCLEAAGEAATGALVKYLQEQRVRKREDLQFLQLDWLISALQPAGLPPLLLNKFLSLAKDHAPSSAP